MNHYMAFIILFIFIIMLIFITYKKYGKVAVVAFIFTLVLSVITFIFLHTILVDWLKMSTFIANMISGFIVGGLSVYILNNYKISP